MKKITFLITLLISTIGFSQSYYSVYIEDTNNDYGGAASISQCYLYNATETPTTNGTAFEGTTHRNLAIGANDWYMAEYCQTAVDLSAYSSGYFNFALRADSSIEFYLRIYSDTGGAASSGRIRLLFNPASYPYGFAADGNWHFMSIPVSDFTTYQGTFDWSVVSRPFLIRSNGTNPTATINIDFDSVFYSTSEVLSAESLEKQGISMYPNPASNQFNIKSLNTIDNITLYSMLGQKVLNVSPKSHVSKLDISSLKTGLYVVEISSNGKKLTSRLVKE